MAERILVPLDGSRTSEKALDYVIKLVGEIKPDKATEVILFEVIKPPVHHYPVEGGVVDIDYSDEELQPVRESALKYLDAKAEVLRAEGIKVSCTILKGTNGESTAETIIKAEKELDGNLLAMSTHGRTGISRWALGSVTEQVLRGGSIPVVSLKA